MARSFTPRRGPAAWLRTWPARSFRVDRAVALNGTGGHDHGGRGEALELAGTIKLICSRPRADLADRSDRAQTGVCRLPATKRRGHGLIPRARRASKRDVADRRRGK